MNYKIIIPLLTLIGFTTSCKSYKIKVYSLSRNIKYIETDGIKRMYATEPNKSIVFISDSTVNYTKIYGHLGASTTIKYRTSNDTLILESQDIYGKNLTENNPDFSNLYLINNDSLTSLQNEEKYYSVSYTKSKTKKFEPFYLIVNNQKIKLDNRRKAIRKLKKLIDQEKDWTELDKEVAKSEYGIPTKFRTYKINE